MRCNDIERFQRNRGISKQINLEKALNNLDLLEDIYKDILHEIGIQDGQHISSDVFEYKGGQVLLQYSEKGKLDRQKVLSLITRFGPEQAKQILIDTTVCLMEDWGIIKGGIKLP
jgi:hypothetical protein